MEAPFEGGRGPQEAITPQMDEVISSGGGDTRFHSVVLVGLANRLRAKKWGFDSRKNYEIFPFYTYKLQTDS